MLGLSLEREQNETWREISFYAERMKAFERGEKPTGADELAARRVWNLSSDGEFLRDDERTFCEVVFSAPPEVEIPLPSRDWSSEINLDITAAIVDELYQKLSLWEPKKDHIRGRTFELKDWDKTSETTKKEYGKRLAAIDKEIQEEQYTDTDIICKLLATVHLKSRSSFYLERAIVQRWAKMNGREELFKLINSLPEYAKIKKRFGERVIFTSPRTKERQRTEISPQIVATLMQELPNTKNQQFAPFVLLLSGARLSELPSVKIFKNQDGSVALKIDTAKLGCARKNAPKTRRIGFDAGSIEAKQLAAIATKCGQQPFIGLNCATFRSNFRAAKKRLETKHPALKKLNIHSFRHVFTTNQRTAIKREFVMQYGDCWQTDAKLREKAKEVLSTRLGHKCAKITAAYGH